MKLRFQRYNSRHHEYRPETCDFQEKLVDNILKPAGGDYRRIPLEDQPNAVLNVVSNLLEFLAKKKLMTAEEFSEITGTQERGLEFVDDDSPVS